MAEFQHTIQATIQLSGVGLHTGLPANLIIEPAPTNHGIRFQRIDLEGEPIVRADVKNVCNTERCTVLEENNARIHTGEHLLAALTGCGVDNALIKIDNVEVPILDGSSIQFVEAIKRVGVEPQEAERIYFPLKEVIRFYDEEKRVEMVAVPAESYQFATVISFDSNVLNTQHAELNNLEDFAEEIAPSRTFCFLHEVEALVDNNLIKGGSLDNAIVFADSPLQNQQQQRLAEFFEMPDIQVEEGILNNVVLRFPNEPARHKLLDVIGDMTLLGMRLHAKIYSTRPGHATNVAFVKQLKEHIKANRYLLKIPQFDIYKEPVYDIKGIIQNLPHRYPFLLIDKIIEMDEEGIVGIKMVTINEPFFVGHFPGEPVMPGVLQLEAMAQTGGILVLNTVDDPENYLTYLLKIDKVKFRQVVQPGDVLILNLKLLSPIRRGLCEMRGEAYVNNKLVTEAEMTAKIVKRT